MPSTNTRELNPVVTLFMCTDEVMGPPDDFSAEDLELPEVAAKDVPELNEHLAGGWKCCGASFGAAIDLRLLALTRAQVEAYGVPPTPAKKQDTRAATFIARQWRHGGRAGRAAARCVAGARARGAGGTAGQACIPPRA